MINFKRILIVMIIGVFYVYGAQPIDEQIQAVLQASPSDRVRLMNQLKLQLASMNEQQRDSAIQMLKTKMSGGTHINIYQMGQQKSNMQPMQMQQTQAIRQNETMKQRQATMPHSPMSNNGKQQ